MQPVMKMKEIEVAEGKEDEKMAKILDRDKPPEEIGDEEDGES